MEEINVNVTDIDGKEYYESLESNEEFQIVLLNFIKKNKSVINEL